MVAKMNGLICGGRLGAAQTDVSVLLQTLSHTQTMSQLNADKFYTFVQQTGFCFHEHFQFVLLQNI